MGKTSACEGRPFKMGRILIFCLSFKKKSTFFIPPAYKSQFLCKFASKSIVTAVLPMPIEHTHAESIKAPIRVMQRPQSNENTSGMLISVVISVYNTQDTMRAYMN